MGYQVDFAALKSGVRIEDIAATMLGVELSERMAKRNGVEEKQFRGRCPICNNARRALTVTPSLQRFWCFGDCNAGGDVIELVARARQVKAEEAGRLIAAHTKAPTEGAARKTPDPENGAQVSKRVGFDPLEYQKTLQPDHPALGPLGVTADTIRAFGGGFCTKGLLIGRLALPLHEAGEIKCFFGIGLPVPHDLKFPKDYPDLFGTTGVQEGETVQLVAHPLEVLKAYENGVGNVICALKPLDWAVVTSIAELLKEHNCTIDL